jgi:hypothetical protein
VRVEVEAGGAAGHAGASVGASVGAVLALHVGVASVTGSLASLASVASLASLAGAAVSSVASSGVVFVSGGDVSLGAGQVGAAPSRSSGSNEGSIQILHPSPSSIVTESHPGAHNSANTDKVPRWT